LLSFIKKPAPKKFSSKVISGSPKNSQAVFSLLLSICLFLGSCGGDTAVTHPVNAPIPLPEQDKLGDDIIIEDEDLSLPERQEIRIGIMLPLSGNNKAIGTALFNAATMALYDSADQRLKIIAGDTKGTPEGAILAMEDMIEARADIIIGPLFAGNIKAIKPQVQMSGINLIGLSTDKSVAGNGVFLLSFRPEEQIKRIVSYAANNGHEKFAALLPQTAYGKIAHKALLDSTLKLEKVVTDIEYYPTSDILEYLMPSVRKIADYTARRRVLLDEREFLRSFGEDDDMAQEFLKDVEKQDTIGEVDYDVILLPDGGQMLKTMAPLLSFFDIDTDKIQVIGTGLWDDPSLFNEPQLMGGWYAAPKREIAQKFLIRYKNNFGEEAPRLATLGYDAFALVASMTRSLREPDFTVKALTNPEGFAGIDGIFRFQASGLAQRGLAIYEITPKGFIMIEEAPSDFSDKSFNEETDPFSLKPKFFQEYDSREARPLPKAEEQENPVQ
jgi:ABC-type branched-subunit amino acid transport system substrate-binding protein